MNAIAAVGVGVVNSLGPPGNFLPPKVALDKFASVLAHPAAAFGLIEHGSQTPRHRVARRVNLQAVFFVVYIFPGAPCVGNNHRLAGAPCFQNDDAKRLIAAGNTDDVGLVKKIDKLLAFTMSDKAY